MNKNPKLDPPKALKHEAKGDKLASKGKVERALKEYRKSESLNPDRSEIYDKLIQTQNQAEGEWSQETFTEMMGWTMRQQELLNPTLEQVYKTLSPDYQEIQKLLQQLMVAEAEEMEQMLVKKILGYGEKSVLPTLHLLLSIKGSAKS